MVIGMGGTGLMYLFRDG